MKFVIAQMQHETNTFSPVPTPWEAFGNNGPFIGSDALEAMSGTALPMAAYLDLARKEGAEIVTPVAAWANPSGPVDGGAYDRICELVCDAVRQGCDAVFLDLHGAMVVEGRTDDGEGTLLERIRAIAPDTPIAVSLDLHANLTERMVRNCNVIAGYKTYPHVDQYEAGELAGGILLRYLKGEIEPVMAWGNRPLARPYPAPEHRGRRDARFRGGGPRRGAQRPACRDRVRRVPAGRYPRRRNQRGGRGRS